MILEKIKCFCFASDYFDGAFLFLDADAVLINTVPELFEMEVDLAVTLRRENEINYEMGNCTVLNSGVLFFGSCRESRKTFLNLWLKKAYETKESIAEQTSLTRLLTEAKDGHLEIGDTINVQLGKGTSAVIGVLSCEQYNFNWIEELDSEGNCIDGIKVLHFKGVRHTLSQFKALADRSVGILKERMERGATS